VNRAGETAVLTWKRVPDAELPEKMRGRGAWTLEFKAPSGPGFKRSEFIIRVVPSGDHWRADLGGMMGWEALTSVRYPSAAAAKVNVEEIVQAYLRNRRRDPSAWVDIESIADNSGVVRLEHRAEYNRAQIRKSPEPGTRAIRYGVKGRLAEDPRGLQVTLKWQGRILLGDVVDTYYQDHPPVGYRLKVRHFNREPWPIDPVPTAVRVLVRTYDEEEPA
jgi:hypothetical protein